MKKVRVIFFLFIFITVGFYLFFKEGTLPYNKTDTTSKIFVINRGEPLQTVINNLAKEDLIRNRLIFYLIVKQLGLERKIQAGEFQLSPAMNAYEIAKTLNHGTLDTLVTLIEGTRKEEMAQILSQKLGIPEVEFIKYGKEGFLFPDTYSIPKDASAEAVVRIMNENFESKLTAEMRRKVYAKGLTIDQVVTLASIVEKEARYDEDKQKVASIILKRLDADWPLQVDATIQYALGYQFNEKSWWKEYLTLDDLKIDSPYNSYLNKGLPPAPISNPGLVAIKAAINADTNIPYWYYMSDKKGIMHYSKTLEEHDENVRKYL